MTKKDVSALILKLRTHLPGWEAKNELLYLVPVGHTLRGVQLERCSDPRGFYANLFFQPLCVPADNIALNLGWRLGGGAHCWYVDDHESVEQLKNCLAQEADPFLRSIRSADNVIAAIKALNVSGDSSARKVLGYSLARAGRTTDAIAELERFVGLLSPAIGWQRTAAEHAIRLITLLSSDEPGAQRQLDAWEQETAHSLGINTTVA